MGILSLFKKQYHPLNRIQIYKSNLLHNYRLLSQMINGQQLAPVLKSNAYGHGIQHIGRILDNVGAPFFCVDSIHEGYQLLKAGVKTPILIIGYIQPENLKVKKLPFSYAVYTEEMLDTIKKYQSHAAIHIFVDTGMHREGVLLKDLPMFVHKAMQYGLHIEGLMSHFGMANVPQSSETQQQIANFVKAKDILRKMQIEPRYIHIAASAGIINHTQYIKSLANVSRVGIALYGIDPDIMFENLKPVLRVSSTIAQIKQLQKGEKIGYDFTFAAKKNMKIAILPIGYNDGVNRKLSNNGYVKLNQTFCPIIGRISMNITTIDISAVPEAKVGDEVIIFSENPEDQNTITKTAQRCGVIPYELLVQLHASTKRIIV